MTQVTSTSPASEIAEDRITLEARLASVAYGSGRVLDGVTASIGRGEIVGIAGPNGSGKTTLLRALAGLVRLEEGEIRLGGTPLSDFSPRDRARTIAYMPQAAAEHSFTALEYVLMGRYPHIGRFRLERRSDVEIAESAMERTGTFEFADRRMQSLSGGERQRVSLARLLAQQGSVLLLDEPTASLDMQHQLLTMSTVRDETTHGAAVAVVLHDLSLAARHCDRLLLLQHGRLVAEGKPWDVITQSSLREIFSVNAAVEPDPISRQPVVSVLGISDGGARDVESRPKRIHIICGAGSGRDLMHRLSLEGFEVTAGVLGDGDADSETARRLGIEYIRSSPFSAISLEQDAAHRRLVREADAVIVCEMAVGPGNLRNLEAAAEAASLLLIERPDGPSWDYTNGSAGRVFAELEARGETVDRDEIIEAMERI